MAQPATSRPRTRSLRARLLPGILEVVRRLPAPLHAGLRPATALAAACVPGWRRRVRETMEAALGPGNIPQGTGAAYFQRLADLVAYSATVYRTGGLACGLESEWGSRTEPQERARAALEGGKGAILVCPHFFGHEILAGYHFQDLPLTFLVRRSPDEEYEAIKQRWYAALGVHTVYRPGGKGAARALGEMTAAVGTLRKNRILAITPDLVQEPGSGVAVTLFGREIWLPAGAFFLSVRTGAPLLPTFYHRGPTGIESRILPTPVVNAGLEREAAIQALAQAWASDFEGFLREHPEMWQFWLDKRWVRRLGGG